MIKFNDILRLEEIDPRQVRLVRHQDKRARPSLYHVWRSDPELLEEYQAIQAAEEFRTGDMLASFVVSPNPERAVLFIGLYLVEAVGRTPAGARDPILGHDVGGMFQFTISRVDKLSEYVGRLTIDWGKAPRTWVQRASRQNKDVVAIQNEVDPPFPGFGRFSWTSPPSTRCPPSGRNTCAM